MFNEALFERLDLCETVSLRHRATPSFE